MRAQGKQNQSDVAALRQLFILAIPCPFPVSELAPKRWRHKGAYSALPVGWKRNCA